MIDTTGITRVGCFLLPFGRVAFEVDEVERLLAAVDDALDADDAAASNLTIAIAIRDRAIVELNANQVKVLGTNLEATQDRFQIGDLTRTDVAQSEARLSLQKSRLILAESRLTASEENYRRVIGRRPDGIIER